MAGAKKKQHYIPQMYLKRFSVDEVLFVYDKETNKCRKSTYENEAHIRYFYDIESDIDLDGNNKQTLENTFSIIEGLTNKVLDRIIDNALKAKNNKWYITNCFSVSIDDMSDITQFAIMQRARTPKQINVIEDFSNLIIRNFLRKYSDIPNNIINEAKVEANFREMMISQFKDINRLTEALVRFLYKSFIVVINNTDETFLTSDYPLIDEFNWIYYPISSNVAIFYVDLNIVFNEINNISNVECILSNINKIYPLSIKKENGDYISLDNKITRLYSIINDKNIINFLNNKQFERSLRFIYSDKYINI